MTTRAAPMASVDWLTSRAGHHPVGYAAKWAAAAVSVAGVMTAAVWLTLWINNTVGSNTDIENAVLIDMAPLPEAPPAIATLEPAPEVPMAELPDSLEPIVQDEPLPDLAEADVAPVMPEPEPLALEPPQADLPPDAEAPPEKPKPEPVPEEKPKPKKPKVEKVKEKPKAPQKPSAETKSGTAASKGQVKSLTSRWGAAIRKKVNGRKSYPSAAKGAEGTATVRLSVSRSGALAGVSLVASSGNAALDKAALSAVSRAGSFPAAPAGLTDSSYNFTLPISFTR
ncbi:energy transducer TonB [Cypionkella sp.]|uniref:energy transducer TonB family protein n=1 Tax=Cypionkella sp. TaxID=2811411 RepID=UPI00262F8AA0|nr:energy transducer TonB [Cypionkella sp.]MDB5665138.1 TonB family protein [Cypionkella sp.]